MVMVSKISFVMQGFYFDVFAIFYLVPLVPCQSFVFPF